MTTNVDTIYDDFPTLWSWNLILNHRQSKSVMIAHQPKASVMTLTMTLQIDRFDVIMALLLRHVPIGMACHLHDAKYLTLMLTYFHCKSGTNFGELGLKSRLSLKKMQ